MFPILLAKLLEYSKNTLRKIWKPSSLVASYGVVVSRVCVHLLVWVSVYTHYLKWETLKSTQKLEIIGMPTFLLLNFTVKDYKFPFQYLWHAGCFIYVIFFTQCTSLWRFYTLGCDTALSNSKANVPNLWHIFCTVP